MKFSVITSVYKNDNPEFVARAIDSITVEQTLKPDEVVLVVDGPVNNDLDTLIKKYESDPLFRVIRFSENKGLGNALKTGVQEARNAILARMDSDDVSAPDRFEKQIRYLEMHPDCDVVGGQMSEFIGDESNIIGIREVTLEPDAINLNLKKRCPLNHVTVMMRKDKVLEAGNYQDWHYNEDYFLWIRMFLHNARFANLADTLVNVRVGKEMYKRRGGWRYFKSEALLQKYMLQNGIIAFPRYTYNTAIRFAVQVALPNNVRGFIFKKIARKHYK